MSQQIICDADGKIARIASCPDEMDALQVMAGETGYPVESGVSHETHYHDGNTFVLFGEKTSEYHVWDWPTKTWVISPTALADAKSAQSTLINKSCQAEIYAGFDSSALGTPHHYPAKAQDQANLVASVTASLIPGIPAEWATPFWCADGQGAWDYVMHTAAQIQQAGADGKLAILAALGKNEFLQRQIAASTSIETVLEIVW